MLDLESGEPLVELDGRLIEESQKTLARLSVAQRAYELLKSQARTSIADDWTATRKGGSDAARVFEAVGGQPLDTVRVPDFFTYAGFQRGFIEPLGDIAERIKQERWVLGPAGEQSALDAQYDNLPDQMLELYTRDFVAAWRDALGKLRLRKLLTDKPNYVVLSRALGAHLAAQADFRIDPRGDHADARTRASRSAGGRRNAPREGRNARARAASRPAGGAPGAPSRPCSGPSTRRSKAAQAARRSTTSSALSTRSRRT